MHMCLFVCLFVTEVGGMETDPTNEPRSRRGGIVAEMMVSKWIARLVCIYCNMAVNAHV